MNVQIKKQVKFISSLSYLLFVGIVIIQNIYYQCTFKEFPLEIKENYNRYLMIWLVLVILTIIIILIFSKNKGSFFIIPFAVSTMSLMPLFIGNYGNLAVLGYIVFTLMYFLIDRWLIERKYR